jgi:uncharacterized protein YecE (DUF72 family)
MAQFDLFPPSPLDVAADKALADARPSCLSIGTSSWTYRGWNGIVFAGNPTLQDLIDHGLSEYSRHPLFSTVSIDRGYYQPLAADDFRRYARQLPSDYRCALKVWNALTNPTDGKTGAANPHFLDAAFFLDSVLSVAEKNFAPHLGPILFQFPSMSGVPWMSAAQFSARLDAFLSKLPADFDYAVELRDAHYLTPLHLNVLRHHSVAHLFNHWERMPTIGSQLRLPNVLTGSCVVSRVLLPQGKGYEAQREAFAPFSHLQAVDAQMRSDVCALISRCQAEQKRIYVLVGNKAEGCSPLTVRGILQQLAATVGKKRNCSTLAFA